MKIGQLFKDKYGKIWKIVNFIKIYPYRNEVPVLFNEELGEGLWDDGKGLIPLKY